MAMTAADNPGHRALKLMTSKWVFSALVFAGFGLLVAYPISLVLMQSFTGRGGADLDQLGRLLGSGSIRAALGNTFLIATLTTLVATPIGVLTAWFVARTNMPGKNWLDPLNMVPFYLSGVVGAIGWQVMASPRTGILNTMLEPIFGPGVFNIYSIWGLSLVMGIHYAPFVYLFTTSSLANMDASLEEAARVSGASTFQSSMRITIPLSAPAILSSTMLVFVMALGQFGVPIVLAVPAHIQTLSTLMYQYLTYMPPAYGTSAFLGLLLLTFAIIITTAQWAILRGRSFTTITGKGYRPQLIDLRGWKWIALGVNTLYLVFVLVPFFVLALVSFQDVWVGHFEASRLTLKHYYEVLFVDVTAKRAFANSLIISTAGASIAVILNLALAFTVVRTRMPGRVFIPAMATAPIAIPGVVLGVGMLLAVIGTPLYGTLLIILIAYLVESMPPAYKNTEAIVRSVSKELDECARISGASIVQAVRHIVFPLISPGLLSVWLLVFVTMIREVSASMMLFVHGTETLAIALIRILTYQPLGVSAAFGVLQTLLLLVCVGTIRAIQVSLTRRNNPSSLNPTSSS